LAGRATYNEGDKARGYVALVTADWLIKRAARESGFPESTLRRWAKEFRENGPPATDEIEAAATDFLEDAERVRNKALLQIEAKLPTARVGELNTTVGILTDKINAAKGLASSRVEHVHRLPSPEELRDAMAAMALEAQRAHELREAEIVDAEFTEDVRSIPTRT
jgi:transposase-like protein